MDKSGSKKTRINAALLSKSVVQRRLCHVVYKTIQEGEYFLCIGGLKKYSDENHRLKQKEIVELIRKEFGVEVERKTIKRDLMKLNEMDYDIG